MYSLSLAILVFFNAMAFQGATAVTGTWAGSLIVKHDGKTEEHYVHVVLKQAGESLTGTAGPTADDQIRILKGKVVTGKGATTISFEFIANGELTSFNLKLVDGLLKGDARIEGEDGKAHVATVELKPVK